MRTGEEVIPACVVTVAGIIAALTLLAVIETLCAVPNPASETLYLWNAANTVRTPVELIAN